MNHIGIAEKRKHLSPDQINSIRQEYSLNPQYTIEFIADKYDRSTGLIDRIIRNKLHYDPDYIRPTSRKGGAKKAIYMPDHIVDERISDIQTNTAHRAKGQNRTINRFK